MEPCTRVGERDRAGSLEEGTVLPEGWQELYGNERGATPAWSRGKLLGAGGFGTVNLAVMKDTGHVFAVKSVKCNGGGDNRLVDELISALHNEHQIMASLSSPYIVKCLGADRTWEDGSEMQNLFLEYVPGGSVVDVMKKLGGKLSEPLVRWYTRGILKGLRYLHQEAKVVHADIKGQNILVVSSKYYGIPRLRSSGRSIERRERGGWVLESRIPIPNGAGLDDEVIVKLVDFGVSKRVGDDMINGRDFLSIRRSTSLRGTVYWMAPEVVQQVEQGPPSDIWSLGCTVIEMATGSAPWAFTDPVVVLYKLACGEELPELPGNLSPTAIDFLRKCLIHDPSARWSACELLQHPFVMEPLVPPTPRPLKLRIRFNDGAEPPRVPVAVLHVDCLGRSGLVKNRPSGDGSTGSAGIAPMSREKEANRSLHGFVETNDCLNQWVRTSGNCHWEISSFMLFCKMSLHSCTHILKEVELVTMPRPVEPVESVDEVECGGKDYYPSTPCLDVMCNDKNKPKDDVQQEQTAAMSGYVGFREGCVRSCKSCKADDACVSNSLAWTWGFLLVGAAAPAIISQTVPHGPDKHGSNNFHDFRCCKGRPSPSSCRPQSGLLDTDQSDSLSDPDKSDGQTGNKATDDNRCSGQLVSDRPEAEQCKSLTAVENHNVQTVDDETEVGRCEAGCCADHESSDVSTSDTGCQLSTSQIQNQHGCAEEERKVSSTESMGFKDMRSALLVRAASWTQTLRLWGLWPYLNLLLPRECAEKPLKLDGRFGVDSRGSSYRELT
ncbi:hypothetical protein CBR_g29621 [Chara braunii]|uniref:Protein kinase domain-containing protein n=1 Tax=Chara braunii TaxID=69332 RepID=A0A388LAX6_CHABU|nr:hypothetical protein CBR_g29621 [Chara braunii]|eukprot:GBG79475.1 hypothetical protein CBR_g29621 [Chara braunii]